MPTLPCTRFMVSQLRAAVNPLGRKTLGWKDRWGAFLITRRATSETQHVMEQEIPTTEWGPGLE
jgi:hypothetical protein